MRPGTARETAIICAAAVVVVALLTIPFRTDAGRRASNGSGPGLDRLRRGARRSAVVLVFRYLITRKRAAGRAHRR